MARTPFDPGPLAQVEAIPEEGDRWTLVFLRTLHHTPERVWKALTDPADLGAWAPYTTDRDLGSVGEATLTMIDGETSEELAATVVTSEPPKLLEYTWGTDFLRWELAPTNAGTRLTLRHTMEDPTWAPKVAAGWHLCLVVAERLLEGRPISAIRGADAKNYGWAELADSYADKLGIAAAPGQ